MFIVKNRILHVLSYILLLGQPSFAQRLQLFAPEVREEYPSVVYDFLERYISELDSLQERHIDTDPRLRDDKVFFLKGDVSTAKFIKTDMPFVMSESENGFYDVAWKDSLNNVFLEIAFPKQFELLLGFSKSEIEKQFVQTLRDAPDWSLSSKEIGEEDLKLQSDGTYMTQPVSNYYVQSLNTATYWEKNEETFSPVFDNADKWHSAANLFQGCVDSIKGYTLYIEQNMYGFQKNTFTIPLTKWLGYCEAMKLKVFFSIEEEREDGLKALLLAQCADLGFNHMMSLIIPANFVEKHNSVIKATLNAYIPTHNVKDLYQQYVERPKKKI